MCANAEIHYNIFTYNKRAIFDCANGGQHISKTGQKKKAWQSKVAGQQKYLCQIHPTVVEPTFKQTFPPVS